MKSIVSSTEARDLPRKAAMLYASESLVYLVSATIDRKGVDYSLEGAATKVFNSESLWSAADEALRVAEDVADLITLAQEKSDDASVVAVVAKVLDRLGIAEEVKAKVTRTEPGKMYEPILNGSKDDIAAGTVTQISADKRLKLIGPLPAELQTYLQYAAIPMAGAPNMKAAIEFVRFLFTPAVKAQLAAAGVE